jgi:hypothetical protein
MLKERAFKGEYEGVMDPAEGDVYDELFLEGGNFH